MTESAAQSPCSYGGRLGLAAPTPSTSQGGLPSRSVRSTRQSRSKPLALRDRPWAGLRTCWINCPADPPSTDALRAVLHHLADVRPDHRIFSRLDTRRRTWTPVEPGELKEWIARLVLDVSEFNGSPEQVVQSWLGSDPGGPPFRLIRAPDAFVVDSSHAVGDWTYWSYLLNELFAAAREDRRPPYGLLISPTAFPLARTIGRYYGRNPGRVLRTLRAAPPAASEVAVDEQADRSRVEPAVVATRFSSAAQAQLAAWRRANSPQASNGATLFALLCAVLADSGLPCVPRTSILIDSRRWLRPEFRVEGNCATAALITPGDARDPVAWTADLSRILESGRPLAATAHAATISALPTALTGSRSTRSSCVDTEITISYYHDAREGCLLWQPDADDRRYAALTAGSEGNSIGVYFYSTGRSLHVCANFDQNRHDRYQLSAIVERVAEAPVHLLTRHGPDRTA